MYETCRCLSDARKHECHVSFVSPRATPSLMHRLRKCWHPRRESWLQSRYGASAECGSRGNDFTEPIPAAVLPGSKGRARTTMDAQIISLERHHCTVKPQRGVHAIHCFLPVMVALCHLRASLRSGMRHAMKGEFDFCLILRDFVCRETVPPRGMQLACTEIAL